MEIRMFDESFAESVTALWNSLCISEMPYKSFSVEGFKNKFIENSNFRYEGTFVGIENGRIIGFINSIYKKEFLAGETFENTPGYITIVIIDKAFRHMGYGTALLKKAEEYLKNAGKTIASVDFFNPINLEWYIPGKGEHDHPNAPGVDVSGSGYEFMKKNGYMERTKEVSMYLDLKQFQINENIYGKIEELRGKGIELGYYDKYRHNGFDELFTDLRNEQWRKEIMDNIMMPRPYPVLVAADNGKICAFTGPVKVQQSGRGLFTGIGVDTAHRSLGIGTALFFMLCESFKEAGAEFMSLFTGQRNNARAIYEAAGFIAVKEWALFRKEI